MRNITLKRAQVEDREILANLLEKYEYEFSQYTHLDVNQFGLYGYRYLDYYWTEEKRWAYFVLVDDKIAGFAMVNDFPETESRGTDFSLSEFFILYKYRRLNVGRTVFNTLCLYHRGLWQLKCHPRNVSSFLFWSRVVSELTKGNYECIKNYPNSEYEDGSLGTLFFFES